MDIVLFCPNCNNYIIIEKINCGIFRHAYYIDTNKQIDPHMAKDKCMQLINENKIYGCGLPFRIINDNNKYIAIKCDWI